MNDKLGEGLQIRFNWPKRILQENGVIVRVNRSNVSITLIIFQFSNPFLFNSFKNLNVKQTIESIAEYRGNIACLQHKNPSHLLVYISY
jgi:hypothetical protein